MSDVYMFGSEEPNFNDEILEDNIVAYYIYLIRYYGGIRDFVKLGDHVRGIGNAINKMLNDFDSSASSNLKSRLQQCVVLIEIYCYCILSYQFDTQHFIQSFLLRCANLGKLHKLEVQFLPYTGYYSFDINQMADSRRERSENEDIPVNDYNYYIYTREQFKFMVNNKTSLRYVVMKSDSRVYFPLFYDLEQLIAHHKTPLACLAYNKLVSGVVRGSGERRSGIGSLEGVDPVYEFIGIHGYNDFTSYIDHLANMGDNSTRSPPRPGEATRSKGDTTFFVESNDGQSLRDQIETSVKKFMDDHKKEIDDVDQLDANGNPISDNRYELLYNIVFNKILHMQSGETPRDTIEHLFRVRLESVMYDKANRHLASLNILLRGKLQPNDTLMNKLHEALDGAHQTIAKQTQALSDMYKDDQEKQTNAAGKIFYEKQCDALQKDMDVVRKEKEELDKNLSKSLQQIATMKSELDCLKSEKKVLEDQVKLYSGAMDKQVASISREVGQAVSTPINKIEGFVMQIRDCIRSLQTETIRSRDTFIGTLTDYQKAMKHNLTGILTGHIHMGDALRTIANVRAECLIRDQGLLQRQFNDMRSSFTTSFGSPSSTVHVCYECGGTAGIQSMLLNTLLADIARETNALGGTSPTGLTSIWILCKFHERLYPMAFRKYTLIDRDSDHVIVLYQLQDKDIKTMLGESLSTSSTLVD